MTDELASLLQDLRHRTAEPLTEEVAVERFGRRAVSVAEETGLIDLDACSDERVLSLTTQGRIRLAVRSLTAETNPKVPNWRRIGATIGGVHSKRFPSP